MSRSGADMSSHHANLELDMHFATLTSGANNVADARDWLDALAAAWRTERGAVRAKLALERAGRLLSERVALGIALSHLRNVDEQSAPSDRVRVKLAVPAAVDLDDLRISPGDPVRMWA